MNKLLHIIDAEGVKKELNKLANPIKAKLLAGFFKTGKGEYGEGDIFLGLTVPLQRKLAQKFNNLSLGEISKLLKSPIHEYRLTALEILVMQYEYAQKSKDLVVCDKIVNFYLNNTKYINNWDLVDLSASYLLGDWLLNVNAKANIKRSVLYKLVKSKNIWERRISIVSTFAFIKAGQFADSLKLAKILLKDEHDLIHKAVGWMLREVGKKDQDVLIGFLDKYANQMPRTMLRYAIEKFPAARRKWYLKMGK